MKTPNNNRRFADNIESCSPTTPLLPLVHTCDAHAFRDILNAKQIIPASCDTFIGENLSYFYYGKPSYRLSKSTDAVSLMSAFPICFITKNPEYIKPKRVYPLDSGAFSRDRFTSYFHKNTKLSDLELYPSLKSAAKVVNKFYDNNKKYFDGDAIRLNVPPLEFEIESLNELFNSKIITNFDDRSSAIEIQFDKNMPLTKDLIELIVIPSRFLDDESIRKQICTEWGTEVRAYHTAHFNPNEYISLIYREVRDFYSDKGLL